MRKKALLAILLFLPLSLMAAKEDLLSFGIGINNLLRDRHRTGEARIEYKSHLEWYKIRPMIGLMGSFRGAIYGYGGFGIDWIIKDHLIFSPNFAAGLYYDGNGRKLGYPVEFRSGVEIGWQFDNKYRVGAHFYHISNAHLGHRNPGEESLVFFISIPIKRYK